MNNLKKSLALLITAFLLLGLTGCSEKKNTIVTSVPKAVVTTGTKTEADNKIELNNLKFTLPANWTKRGNESEIFFEDETKQTVGGISVIGI